MNMSKIWAAIASLFSVLVGLFFWERNKRQDAEAQLDNANTDKNDAVLGQHTADVQEQINKDKAAADAAKSAPATNDDLLNFLNKKN